MGDLKSRSIKALIGGRQHVRNYPGVTVERKEGFRRYGGMEMRIVDLPGTYSLTGMVGEEQKKSVRKTIAFSKQGSSLRVSPPVKIDPVCQTELI